MKTILTGAPERIYVEYRDSTNTLVDPTRPKVAIWDPIGTVIVSSADCIQESTGVYYYLFGVGTAYAVNRGTYQAWFEGYINGAPITMDEPIYFDVIDTPIIYSDTAQGRAFARSVRVAVGDVWEDDYLVAPVDLSVYIQDGVNMANSVYDFGYDVYLSTAGNDKTGRLEFRKAGVNSTLTLPARNWYLAHTVKRIMETQVRLNMYGTGNIRAGDINFNISTGLREQTNYLKLLNEDLKDLAYDLKMNGAGGVLINNYSINDLTVSKD